MISNDSDNRQALRIMKNYSDELLNDDDEPPNKINGFSRIKEYFMYYIEDFPSSDNDYFQEQLDVFLTIFELINSNLKSLNDFQKKSFDFVQETNFPKLIYSLIMNQSLDMKSQSKVFKIFIILTNEFFITENLDFIEDDDFLNQLLAILQCHKQLENFDQNVFSLCFCSILNILQFYPNSIFYLNKSGITDYVATELLNSENIKTFSHSARYILKIIQQTTDIEQKNFLLHQTIVRLNETMEKRPLTFLLQIILECIKDQPDVRTLLVEENICEKCVNIILMMKNTNLFTQYYGDYAIQILSFISNEGNENEFQILLDSDVFEAFFGTVYNFLDISPNIKVDSDSYDYVCSFLIGVIGRNDQRANQLLLQYDIYSQICFVFFNGPTEKRLSSLLVIVKSVEMNNIEMCQLLLEDKSLVIIFDMLSTMDSTILKAILHILIKLISINPKAKECYNNNDLVSRLESLFIQHSLEKEEIDELEILLNYVQENLE